MGKLVGDMVAIAGNLRDKRDSRLEETVEVRLWKWRRALKKDGIMLYVMRIRGPFLIVLFEEVDGGLFQVKVEGGCASEIKVQINPVKWIGNEVLCTLLYKVRTPPFHARAI